MAEMNWDIETVEMLLKKLKEHDVTRVKIKNDEFEITVENQGPTVSAGAAVSAGTAVCAAPDAANSKTIPSPPGQKPEETPVPARGSVMKSPLIGTFYAASSPQSAPFVSVGQKVSKGEVLFIVESMKLMNEIKSDYDGVVKEILVQNGDSVDYNQPIMIIE